MAEATSGIAETGDQRSQAEEGQAGDQGSNPTNVASQDSVVASSNPGDL